MKKIVALLAALFIIYFTEAQKPKWVVAGPMLGYTELRTSKVWVEMQAGIASATLRYQKENGTAKTITLKKTETAFPNVFVFSITALDPGTKYNYTISAPPQTGTIGGSFTTNIFWQWRNIPVPDFSFITGSCAYFNQPEYDRLSRAPYGGDSSIFEMMAKEKSDFMLWLGDNWYTRVPDYFSAYGLNYRASRDRSLPVMQNFLKAMPHYAIWDDHDYGPNDADKSYVLKDDSRKVFMNYWCNPSYGMNGQGTYTELIQNDVAVFMLDDRWFRSNDELPDSMNGAPNKNKKMFGDEQMEWLKNALLFSKTNPHINFRIIATGSQVLNPMSPFDCMRHFSAEYNELMNFITDNKIGGIIFLTGDRHHSEIIKIDRQGAYPLYDITSSPLTSGVAKTKDAEQNNPYRIIPEIDAQNYTRFTFTGDIKNRKLTVTFLGVHGEQLGEWSVNASELAVKKD